MFAQGVLLAAPGGPSPPGAGGPPGGPVRARRLAVASCTTWPLTALPLTALSLTALTLSRAIRTIGPVGRPLPCEARADRRGTDSPADAAMVDEVSTKVRTALRELAAAYAQAGRSLAEAGSADAIAERMVATVPTPSSWDERIGPFYGPGQAAKVLGGVSRQALAERRARRTVLALRTADGAFVYPTFQFAGGGVVPGLAGVVQAFAADEDDDWTLAAWLVAPRRALGGRSVVGWLRDGEDPAVAAALAAEAAERLAR